MAVFMFYMGAFSVVFLAMIAIAAFIEHFYI
jgi:hypothetical protein